MRILIIYDEATGEVIVYEATDDPLIPMLIEPRTENSDEENEETIH